MSVSRILFGLYLIALACPRVGADWKPNVAKLEDGRMVMPLLPQLVSPPRTDNPQWSSDGSYVIATHYDLNLSMDQWRQVIRSPGAPPGDLGTVELIVWDKRTARTRPVWRGQMPREHPEDVQWMPGSDIALAVIRNDALAEEGGGASRRLLRIDASARKAQVLLESKEEFSTFLVRVSPAQPTALVVWPPPVAGIQTISSRGEVSPFVPAPQETEPITSVEWSTDGQTAYLGKGGQDIRYRLDNAGETLVAVETPVDVFIRRVAEHSPLDVRPAHLPDEKREPVEIPCLMLGEVLIASDAKFHSLSPDQDAVVYTAHDALWVTRLMKVTDEDLSALTDSAEDSERAMVMSRGKEVAMALLIYASDHGDVLPEAGVDLESTLSPYVKNAEALRSFVYNLPGGPLESIEDPSSTPMGYIDGPEGRAVVYVDGHVEWVD